MPKRIGQGQGQEPLPELSHRIHGIGLHKLTHFCNVKKGSGILLFPGASSKFACLHLKKKYVFTRQSVTDHGSSARSADLIVEG